MLCVTGRKPDRLAKCGDGRVKLSLAVKRIAEVELGFGAIGLEPNGLAQRGYGFVVLFLRIRPAPRYKRAWALLGARRTASLNAAIASSWFPVCSSA